MKDRIEASNLNKIPKNKPRTGSKGREKAKYITIQQFIYFVNQLSINYKTNLFIFIK